MLRSLQTVLLLTALLVPAVRLHAETEAAPPKTAEEVAALAAELMPPALPAEVAAPAKGLLPTSEAVPPAEADGPILPALPEVPPVPTAAALSGVAPAQPDAPPGRTQFQRVPYTGWMGGGTIYALKPWINDNPAYTITRGLGTARSTLQTEDFDWSFAPAFATWFGWSAANGLGLRARYFQFDQGSRPRDFVLSPAGAAVSKVGVPANVTPFAGGNFGSPGVLLGAGYGQDHLQFSSGLQIYSIDMEGTWNWNRGCFNMLVSGGGRYLHLNQNYQALATNRTAFPLLPPDPFAGGIILPNGNIVPPASLAGLPLSETQSLSYLRSFNGGGPTLSWLGRFYLGQTGLAAFGSARGSLLVGGGRERTIYSQSVQDPTTLVGGNQSTFSEASRSFDQVMPVAELELGLEYGIPLNFSRLFVRGGVVNQTYFNTGSVADHNSNLSLFGGQLSVGLNY